MFRNHYTTISICFAEFDPGYNAFCSCNGCNYDIGWSKKFLYTSNAIGFILQIFTWLIPIRDYRFDI